MYPFLRLPERNTIMNKTKDEVKHDLLNRVLLGAIKVGAKKFQEMDEEGQKQFRNVLDDLIITIGGKINELNEHRQVAIDAMLKIEGKDNGTNTSK